MAMNPMQQPAQQKNPFEDLMKLMLMAQMGQGSPSMLGASAGDAQQGGIGDLIRNELMKDKQLRPMPLKGTY